jgi:hypothetical protein
VTSERVSATAAALELIGQLVARHGALMFHQSGGCCDGSAPMCLARGELQIGAQDVYLGQIGQQPFYIGAAQFEYWQHTHLTIDVVPGRGGMFSLEGPLGVRFITRSRLYTPAEEASLPSVRRGPAG